MPFRTPRQCSADLRILLLVAHYTDDLSYYEDWVDAFRAAPQFRTIVVDIASDGAAASARAHLRECDLVVLHHSTNADTMRHLTPLLGLLKDRRTPLLSFVGNEISLPSSPLAPKIAFLKDVEADFIATQLPLGTARHLYVSCTKSQVVAFPHALNPRVYRPEREFAARDLDIGTRNFTYNLFIGDDDRNRIIDFFQTASFDPPLLVDLSGQRFDRAGWATFLNRCRGTVSTEAGTWFLEPDDATMHAIRRYLAQNGYGRLLVKSDSLLRTMARLLPAAVRNTIWRIGAPLIADENNLTGRDKLLDIKENVLRYRSRPAVYGKCISSRHFEAIGTHTCQIMLAGHFNGILRPDEHYIALLPDFSNAKEAISRFRDNAVRNRIVEKAYALVMDAHTYQHRMQQLAALAGAAV